MRCRLFIFGFKIDLNNLNYQKMKSIFKSIIGMFVMTVLFMFIGVLIQLYIPELEPLTSFFKGFLTIIFVMGFVIISIVAIDWITSIFLKVKW